MPLLKRIKKGYLEFIEQSTIVAKEYGGNRFKYMIDMGWCMLRYGARPIDYVRFEFHKKSAKERNRYLTIYRYFRVIKHFGAGFKGVNGKVEEYQTFSKFINRDWIVINQDSSPELIDNFIKKHGRVIAKPVIGEQGKDVIKIDGIGSEEYKLLINKKGHAPFILEQEVKNCAELGIINPSSLNTVRATTFILKDGTPKIISIILRVGAPGSHVDNWGAGGIGYNFDLETGICNMYGRDKKNKPYVFHPGSNEQMIGFKLPRFEDLKSYVYELMKVFPEARYVGWDIAITPNGFSLIEMNCPAGHDMFQSFNNPVYDLMINNW